MTIPYSPITTEPTLSDLMDLLKKEILFDLNSHHLATIQSFDSTEITVAATINYSKTFFQLNQQGLYSAVQEPYPTLTDIPVIFLGGGNANLTFPIAKGDQCLLLFNDRSIDNWFQGAQAGALTSSRSHSLADGFALVGLNVFSNSGTVDPTRAVLSNGQTGVGVSSSKVKIYNDTYTLNTLLQNILTQLETLANSVCAIGSPLNPAVATQLTMLANELGSLLE